MLADRLRSDFAQTAWAQLDVLLDVTASFGVTSASPTDTSFHDAITGLTQRCMKRRSKAETESVFSTLVIRWAPQIFLSRQTRSTEEA